MKKSRFSDQQIAFALQQAGTGRPTDAMHPLKASTLASGSNA